MPLSTQARSDPALDDLQMPSPARSESPMSPSPTQPTAGGGGVGGIPSLANFSVINYVGKIQKQSSYKTSVRSRTPYEKCSLRSAAAAGLEPLVDDTTSSSSEFGCGSTVSSGSGGLPCGITSPEPSDPMDSIDTTEDGSSCTTATAAAGQNRVRSRRSISVSSSGCSSSMDDRNCDFSPLGSIVSCRCNSYSMSDFDDDGFREDSSVSTYAVFSASRSYHHPLHHHHQNVPHHPNNHKGLFDIALKTVRLIWRNQELQLRLSELQDETNAFIESVMANPENEPLRNHFYGAQNQRIPVAPPVAVQK